MVRDHIRERGLAPFDARGIADYEPRKVELYALHHDSAEAYIGDLPSGLKRMLEDEQRPESVYHRVEKVRGDDPD